MAEEKPLGFALGISPIQDEEGNTVSWHVQSKNFGIQQETVITLVRNWLRETEDDYHAQFRSSN